MAEVDSLCWLNAEVPRQKQHNIFVSERTVKYYMGEIIQRLQMKNRAQVLGYARRMHLVWQPVLIHLDLSRA